MVMLSREMYEIVLVGLMLTCHVSIVSQMSAGTYKGQGCYATTKTYIPLVAAQQT